MQNYSILLNATSDITLIYLIKNDQKIIDKVKYNNHQDLSYKLIEYINSLITKNDLTIKDIKKWYLVYGPGKFSAMRICSTTLKSISYINQNQLYIIDKFNFMKTPNCICIVKSDGNKSFICEYKNDLQQDDVRLVDNQYLNNVIERSHLTPIYDDQEMTDQQIINKLVDFEPSDENFDLKYLKSAC